MDKTERMSAAEYREYIKKGLKKNKYNAKKTEFDGRTYDSQRESERAAELKLLQMAGEVVKVYEQAPFSLPGGIIYKADFVILWRDGSWTVEDVKSEITQKNQVYIIKKKLMLERYGIEIQEV